MCRATASPEDLWTKISLIIKYIIILVVINNDRIWQQIDIDDMQFRLTKYKGTTDAIFIVRQMQKFTAKGKKLYFGFVDLEKKLLIGFREK